MTIKYLEVIATLIYSPIYWPIYNGTIKVHSSLAKRAELPMLLPQERLLTCVSR